MSTDRLGYAADDPTRLPLWLTPTPNPGRIPDLTVVPPLAGAPTAAPTAPRPGSRQIDWTLSLIHI